MPDMQKEVIKELDGLLACLEANIPANPEAPANIKLADALEKDLKKYFKKLEDAVPMGKLEQIYNRYVEQ